MRKRRRRRGKERRGKEQEEKRGKEEEEKKTLLQLPLFTLKLLDRNSPWCCHGLPPFLSWTHYNLASPSPIQKIAPVTVSEAPQMQNIMGACQLLLQQIFHRIRNIYQTPFETLAFMWWLLHHLLSLFALSPTPSLASFFYVRSFHTLVFLQDSVLSLASSLHTLPWQSHPLLNTRYHGFMTLDILSLAQTIPLNFRFAFLGS